MDIEKKENVTESPKTFKPLSVTTNVVGLQTDDAGHLRQNSGAHVDRVVGSQTDAVVVTETRFKFFLDRRRVFLFCCIHFKMAKLL